MMANELFHKWLKIPYTLHVHTDQKVANPRATILFLHGIGNSGAAWDDILAGLPKDVRLITIDLLGFGESQRPNWAVYNAKTQARSVMATFLKLRLRGQIIIVGHSLGSLVAVEIAKRYPLLVRSLVLFSPPFYKPETTRTSPDRALKEIYTLIQKHPGQFLRISSMAVKLGLTNKSFSLTEDEAPLFMNALEASIINQTSLKDVAKLTVPIQILYGQFDPVVLGKNIRTLAKTNHNISATSVLAAHEVKGRFVAPAIKAITNAADKK
jgi:pimeloyl-ACP methyl ester carboxylesterase